LNIALFSHFFSLNCIELSENKLCSKCRTPFTVIAPNWSLIERIDGEFTNDKANQLLSKASSITEEFGDNNRKLNNLNKIQLSKIKDEINERELFLLQQMKNEKMKILKLVEDYERENEEDFNRNSEKKDEFVKKFEEFEQSLNSNAELVSTVTQIKKQIGNLKESNRFISSHFTEEKYTLKVNSEPDSYPYGQLFSTENSKYLV
jgi:phosphoenolpyruvate carboxylase